MEKLGIKICFHSEKDRKDLLNKIVGSNQFGFEPKIMEIDYNERKYDKKKALSLIQKTTKNTGVSFMNDDIEILIGFSAIVIPPLTVSLVINNDVYFDYDSVIENYLSESDFMSAYVYDYNDVNWQSETSISEYESNNINHKDLPKVKDEWDNVVIDISNNYGREVLLNNTWLMACSKMWFSDLFFEITGLSKEHLLKCPEALGINDDKIVKINLFENIFSSSKNRIKQKEFREFANFDKIEKKLYPY